jgi:hypothetical protein
MNRVRKPSLFVATMLALAAVAPPAAASSVPGSAGTTLNSADTGCFAENWGGVNNNCPNSTRLIRYSLTAHAAGWTTVYVAAQGTGDVNDVKCEAQTVYADRVLASNSTLTALPAWSTATQVYQLNSVYLPPGGALFVNCYVRYNSFINNISYSP